MAADARSSPTKVSDDQGEVLRRRRSRHRPHRGGARGRRGKDDPDVDTNQTYSAKGFIRTFARIERLDIRLVEQPVTADDWQGLSLCTRTLPVAVEADESAGSLADVAKLVNVPRMADVINLKVPKLGGIRNTMKAVALCEANGIGCRLGAAFGPALLQAVSAHVASAFRRLEYPCELAEHLHLLDDPFTPLPVEDGVVTVPTGPGSGVVLA